MHIHILETGAPPTPLDAEYGGYPMMMEQMLAPMDGRFRFTSSAIWRHEAPPPVSAVDGVVITGSPAGVYEGDDWIAPALNFVRAAADAARPQVGICFGHQLMAAAFGGRVERAEKGWATGVHAYDIPERRDWMRPEKARIACTALHQDQVVTPPRGARVIAASDFCPYAGLDYAQGPAISFQSHPEYEHGFADALLRLLRGRISAGLVDQGLASLKRPSDRTVLAQWIAAFLLDNRRS
ncbi:MAG: type 1 glutamine amidotransferase [Pseudomonadota bacterium]